MTTAATIVVAILTLNAGIVLLLWRRLVTIERREHDRDFDQHVDQALRAGADDFQMWARYDA